MGELSRERKLPLHDLPGPFMALSTTPSTENGSRRRPGSNPPVPDLIPEGGPVDSRLWALPWQAPCAVRQR